MFRSRSTVSDGRRTSSPDACSSSSFERTSSSPAPSLSEHMREDSQPPAPHVAGDRSQCGACTVHVDGHAVKSCSMLAVQADGGSVTTIQGLAPSDGLHPLQQAFWE